MMRICTEPTTFVQNHGIDSYKKTFHITDSIDTLLKDPSLFEANDIYEEENGVSYKDLTEFIEKWGFDMYNYWCVREGLEPEFPFHRGLRDENGRPIPEPELPVYMMENGWPVPVGAVLELPLEHEIYIRKNGIIFYMIRFKPDFTLIQLLSYKNIASWQRSYIRDLESRII